MSTMAAKVFCFSVASFPVVLLSFVSIAGVGAADPCKQYSCLQNGVEGFGCSGTHCMAQKICPGVYHSDGSISDKPFRELCTNGCARGKCLPAAPQSCGNGIIEGNEECDSGNLLNVDATQESTYNFASFCTDRCMFSWPASDPVTCTLLPSVEHRGDVVCSAQYGRRSGWCTLEEHKQSCVTNLLLPPANDHRHFAALTGRFPGGAMLDRVESDGSQYKLVFSGGASATSSEAFAGSASAMSSSDAQRAGTSSSSRMAGAGVQFVQKAFHSVTRANFLRVVVDMNGGILSNVRGSSVFADIDDQAIVAYFMEAAVNEWLPLDDSCIAKRTCEARPSSHITRGEAADIIERAFGLERDRPLQAAPDLPDDHPWKQSMGFALSLCLLKTDAAGNARPDAALSYAETMEMVFRIDKKHFPECAISASAQEVQEWLRAFFDLHGLIGGEHEDIAIIPFQQAPPPSSFASSTSPKSTTTVLPGGRVKDYQIQKVRRKAAVKKKSITDKRSRISKTKVRSAQNNAGVKSSERRSRIRPTRR